MDFSLLVIIWIVILVVENVFGKKKNIPPQKPENSSENSNFDIPTLANDPNFPDENLNIFQDEVKPAEFRNFNQTGSEKIFQRTVEEKKSSDVKENLPLNLTADSAMNAVVLSEILGKPKALQRR